MLKDRNILFYQYIKSVLNCLLLTLITNYGELFDQLKKPSDSQAGVWSTELVMASS